MQTLGHGPKGLVKAKFIFLFKDIVGGAFAKESSGNRADSRISRLIFRTLCFSIDF